MQTWPLVGLVVCTRARTSAGAHTRGLHAQVGSAAIIAFRLHQSVEQLRVGFAADWVRITGPKSPQLVHTELVEGVAA